MALQFLHDTKGNITGVFVPIDEWERLITKCTDLQNEKSGNLKQIADWQLETIEEKLTDYYKKHH